MLFPLNVPSDERNPSRVLKFPCIVADALAHFSQQSNFDVLVFSQLQTQTEDFFIEKTPSRRLH